MNNEKLITHQEFAGFAEAHLIGRKIVYATMSESTITLSLDNGEDVAILYDPSKIKTSVTYGNQHNPSEQE